ncbi:MAG: TonB-dependent receptor plug domain-containing protein [Sphingobacteriaceae bacterium]|nr:TonB-dependent receptor plug domain-containing protein [Sphingobacteriaceae bacterium]
MRKNIYLAVVFAFFTSLAGMAQTGNGAIKVVLQDKVTKETIPFANVVAYKDGVQVGVATTDMEGEATIKPLEPGKYSIKGVYVGYQAQEIKDVVVGDGKTAYVTIGLSNGEGVKLDEVEVVVYQVPLIDPDTKSGQTVTREDYQNLATKDVNSVAATTAGVYQADNGGGINVRGGRSGNTTYFVDGVKVFGTPNLPQQGIEQLNVITGGVPAMYGDLTSGAISISTRGPQSKYFGGIELISSQLTDPYGYNSLGYSFGGPIYKKKDSTQRTVLGFFLSGQGTYNKDPRPQFIPVYMLKEEKLQEIKDAPLLPSPSGTGFIRSSEFVTKEDMYTQKYRPNATSRGISLTGKLDFQPVANTNISLGGFFNYGKGYNAGIGSQLFNYANHSVSNNLMYRTSLSITQKFGSGTGNKDKKQSIVTNPFFRFLVSWENNQNITQSDVHKDRIFDYGYVGKFERTFLEKDFAYNYAFTDTFLLGGQNINAYVYQNRSENEVKFTPGTLNPDAALYTSYLISQSQDKFISMNYIQGNNGVINGDGPDNIYGLFSNFGSYPGSYTKFNLKQFRVASSFNADIKNHAITFGMELDQQFTSQYNVAASSLWIRMDQLANFHTQSLDNTNPQLVPQFSGLIPYYYFDRAYDADRQTQFSKSLLAKLGLPENYTGFVNVNEMDPSTFSLDMFSAEDLLGSTGNTARVFYQGYDHTGAKTKGKTDIDKFLNEKDANGRNLFPVGTFNPIYSSVYIMDKFDFKDMKFNIGLRVDRYDANQPVLKDKFALHDLARVGDLASLDYLPNGFASKIPGNISKDAAVYISQGPKTSTVNGQVVTTIPSNFAITGFREGDKWYDAQGGEISDPTLINASEGKPVPLFKDKNNYNERMSKDGFTDYKAAVNAMPRVAFSFPISDVANFFSHYDVLVQRPTGLFILPLEYYFLGTTGGAPLITNPNQKPQQTIDYELGFSQILNERKNAKLAITSFYREMRNMINQRMVVGAYPQNYVMYDNIDFSTVKGLSFEFDFRRTGGSRINANYTLQFAEGSGSNANSGANLAGSGQPNLRVLTPLDFDQRHSVVLNYDYRFGKDKDYKGPTFKKKDGKVVQILSDVGFNLTFMIGSGTPYTRHSAPYALNGNAKSNIVGQINGSNKPWNFRSNLRVDKNIPLTWGKKDSDNRKRANLNVYVQVLNLFNTRNVLGVYAFTGEPDDDGYLTSSQAAQQLALTNSPNAFVDMYNIRMNVPGNYSLPRQTRLGLLFEF